VVLKCIKAVGTPNFFGAGVTFEPKTPNKFRVTPTRRVKGFYSIVLAKICDNARTNFTINRIGID